MQTKSKADGFSTKQIYFTKNKRHSPGKNHFKNPFFSGICTKWYFYLQTTCPNCVLSCDCYDVNVSLFYPSKCHWNHFIPGSAQIKTCLETNPVSIIGDSRARQVAVGKTFKNTNSLINLLSLERLLSCSIDSYFRNVSTFAFVTIWFSTVSKE